MKFSYLTFLSCVGLYSILASPASAADDYSGLCHQLETKSSALAANWEKAQSAAKPEESRAAAVAELRLFWQQQLDIAYQRGLSQYPETAQQYKVTHEAWEAYRDCFIKFARALAECRQHDAEESTWTQIDEDALYTQLTLCRLAGLLNLESWRSFASNKPIMGQLKTPFDIEAEKSEDDLLVYLTSRYPYGDSTRGQHYTTSLKADFFDAKLKLVMSVVDSLVSESDEYKFLFKELVSLEKHYRQLEELTEELCQDYSSFVSDHLVYGVEDKAHELAEFYMLLLNILRFKPWEFGVKVHAGEYRIH